MLAAMVVLPTPPLVETTVKTIMTSTPPWERAPACPAYLRDCLLFLSCPISLARKSELRQERLGRVTTVE